MEKEYVTPEMEFESFRSEDVITTFGEFEDQDIEDRFLAIREAQRQAALRCLPFYRITERIY